MTRDHVCVEKRSIEFGINSFFYLCGVKKREKIELEQEDNLYQGHIENDVSP